MPSTPGPPAPSTGGVDPTSANVWVECGCGHRHWGRYGAAGLLLIHRPRFGEPSAEVALQLRAEWTHHGGTWALPGGARGLGESAADAALREAGEEAGLTSEGLALLGEMVVDHGLWAYTYVLAEAPSRLPLAATDRETDDVAWVPLADVASYPLHPHFAEAWPSLLTWISS